MKPHIPVMEATIITDTNGPEGTHGASAASPPVFQDEVNLSLGSDRQHGLGSVVEKIWTSAATSNRLSGIQLEVDGGRQADSAGWAGHLLRGAVPWNVRRGDHVRPDHRPR